MCQQALKDLENMGFTDVMDMMYDATAPADGDGVANGEDVDCFNALVIKHACREQKPC
jgi:hypothetical protein